MYPGDHAPPHFHAIYAEFRARIDMETIEISEGFLPGRAMRLLKEWAELHREELARNWEIAERRQSDFIRIEPLA